MGIIDRLQDQKRRPHLHDRRIAIKAGYQGGMQSRILADMVTGLVSADTDRVWTLQTLRARCRDLAINNDYVRKFLWMVVTNVVGPKGILLQAKMKDALGVLDKENNRDLEKAFFIWGQKKNCTVTGMNSWPSFQAQVIKTVARDGEIFIRKLEGFQNDFGFALQALEADYVDEFYNDKVKNIRMGIEYDSWRRPVAYYFRKLNIFDYQTTSYSSDYFRVPASEVIHLFIQERPEQGRGAPWIATPMARLNILGGYEEAELVACRGSAAKMGFYESGAGDEYEGEKEDQEGNPIQEVEPGLLEKLPKGFKFIPYDPQHPTTQYGNFVKSCLRGISSGLLVSYNALANDLEGVNYSSIRQGVIDERDIWKIFQSWLIEHFHQEVFEAWKSMAILSGKIKKSIYEKMEPDDIRWQPRGWAWVDPSKDVDASRMEIESGLNSRGRILAETGEDFEDTLRELTEEDRLIKESGLTLSVTSSPKGTPMGQVNEDVVNQSPVWNRARRRKEENAVPK